MVTAGERRRLAVRPQAAKMASASLRRQRIYSLAEAPGPSELLRRLYHRILAPLTLFPAARRGRSAPDERREEPPPPPPPAPRTIPVPISLTALLQLVQGRLRLGPRRAQVPEEARDAFREIILGEVRRAFKDVQLSLSDPAHSAQVNRELYQHLVVYLVLVCQHLFLHYAALLEERRALRVFTDYANLVRFSALLSLDCASLLKVSAVRRRLALEMKTLQHCPPELPAEDFSPRLRRRAGCRLAFSMSYFTQIVTPRVLTLRQKMARDLRELQDIPPLDMNKIRRLNLPTAERLRLRATPSPAGPAPGPHGGVKPQRAKRAPLGRLKGTQSLPNMRAGKLLADELGIRLTPRPLSPNLWIRWAEAKEDDFKGPEALAEDLRRLVQGPLLKSSPGKEEQDEESELPPLIKTLTWRKSNEIHQQQLQRILYALQREETFEMKRRGTLISAPALHPQATTMNLKVPGKMVVKAADTQVSERTYVEAVGMEKCPPAYNHLLGEIDNATVKALDANLSAGEEVREMYKELANTIPKDHLKIDLGPLTEPPGYNIDLSDCFASSTLSRRKSQQVINDELSKILPAGPFSPAEVSDTPGTPTLPFKKNLPAKMFTSWFRWWKATFNTDDYLKYISTKNSDYLPVVFHLYDSEGSSEAEATQPPAVDKEELQKQEKMKQAAIRKAVELQKGEFEAGKWNPDSAITKELETVVCCSYKPEDLRVFQRRLERLWTVLHFSEQDRLEMAVKYSSNQYYLLLPDMLTAWEEAAQWIQNRELLLTELELFEEAASDPNRLFSGEPQAFSLRLEESKTRNRLHAELARYESLLRSILNHIKQTFNDTVTYRGQPYLKKMAWDTVEMLYWLQQERRGNTLKKEVQRGSWRQKNPGLS